MSSKRRSGIRLDIFRTHVLAVILLAATATEAWAIPRRGDVLPHFAGKNLEGDRFTSSALRGTPTLLVVITDKKAAPVMREWFVASQKMIPGDVDRLSLASLDMPFYVPYALVQSRARKKVPRQYWDDVLLDDTGEMARALGISEGKGPVVMAVGADGKVLATAHGAPGGSAASHLWQALRKNGTAN